MRCCAGECLDLERRWELVLTGPKWVEEAVIEAEKH